ncbi:hypothetical protein [Rathayibacter sp. SD072]|uniref:hypothetical protein n=1 Tax=Rathayibacter sp. SD072 TaxID=2781731 RepID=UPI001A96526D|nr:hypothetical protein [Rathayibacter sp. SD072]MBO0982702.1 hypothetical protein [Rathayibacter sp. SD072]
MSVSVLPRRTTFLAPRSEWVAVGSALWVALSSGLHQGRVETLGGAFAAIDDSGRTVGEFPTLREAMTAVENHLVVSDVAA